MDYFFYGRDRPEVADLRRTVMEAHWSYMDGFADRMIARGPTLACGDHAFMTGSMHMVELPDRTAAERFAYDEPFQKAGVFGELLVYRWRNECKRTMWEFAGRGGSRFLVMGHGRSDAVPLGDEVHDEQREYVAGVDERGAVIAYGPWLSDDGGEWLGSAVLIEAEDRAEVETIIDQSPYAREGMYGSIEIHDWRFGGRPTQS